jgi:hypothetical protein
MKRSAILLAAVGTTLVLGACSQFTLAQNGTNPPVALVYGVSRYLASYPDGYSPNLVAPRDDANSLGTLLAGNGWQVLSRIDSQASAVTLQADVANLAATAAAGQRVLFYWSGHGLQTQNSATSTTASLALYGSLVPSPYYPYYTLQSTALVTPESLAAIFKPLLDKGVCLITVLDSCYSGGFVSTGSYGSDLPDNYDISGNWGETSTGSTAFAQSLTAYFDQAAAGSGLGGAQSWVLSAAGANEESWETTTFGHGVFTYFFLEAGTASASGLLPGDANLDGHLTLQEAFRYSQAAIEANWNGIMTSNDLRQYDYQYKPHLSGNPLDILLF